jgi:hypothetical protein
MIKPTVAGSLPVYSDDIHNLSKIPNRITLTVSKEFCKRLPDPFESARFQYVVLMPLDQVVHLAVGNIDPRDPNLKKSPTAKDIRSTMENKPELFHMMNLGVFMVVPGASYNQDKEELIIEYPADWDIGRAGISNGLHTWVSGREFAKDLIAKFGAVRNDGKPLPWFNVRIFVNAEQYAAEMSSAQNASAEMPRWALYSFGNEFDSLKKMILSWAVANEIETKPNEGLGTPGAVEKPFDLLDVLQRLTLLNFKKYPNPLTLKGTKDVHPIRAYSQRSSLDEFYVANEPTYLAMANIAEQVFALPDLVECLLPTFAPKYSKLATKTFLSPRKTPKSYKTLPAKYKADWDVSQAVVFPVTAALRALVDPKTGNWRKGLTPEAFLKQYGEILWEKVDDNYGEYVGSIGKKLSGTLTGLGKDRRFWEEMYSTVAQLATSE